MRAQAHFGVVMRRRRDTLGMTQKVLGQLSQFNRSYVADLERGAANPSLGTILRIADALHLSAAELMQRVESEIKRDRNYEPDPKQPLRNLKMKKKITKDGDTSGQVGAGDVGIVPRDA